MLYFNSSQWDTLFVGREPIIEKILETRKNFFIFGARRIGKTSLLKFVEERFWEDKIPAFYLSIQGYSNSEKIQRKMKNCFKRKNVSFDESLFELSFFDFLDELSLRLERLHQQFVFLIDEAEQIAEIDNTDPGFVDQFRNSAESLENIRFILTASPHFKKAFLQSRCSAFLSAFEVHMLPVMTVQEISHLMREMVHDIESNEIEEILQFTSCQPYLAKIFLGKLLLMSGDEISQIIRKFVPEIRSEEIKGILQFDDYQPDLIKVFMGKLSQRGELQSALQFIAENIFVTNALDGIFPNYFQGLSDDDQEIVREVHLNQFQFDPRNETKLKKLTEYGYLKHEAGKYEISSWFFKHWLNGEFGVSEQNRLETQDDDLDLELKEEIPIRTPESPASHIEEEKSTYQGKPLPQLNFFHRMQKFIDIEYALVFIYGCYKLVFGLIELFKGGKAYEKSMLEAFLNDQTAAFMSLTSLMILFVFDYTSRRVMTLLGPCRSNSRLSLNIAIALFFALGFFSIPNHHPLTWGAAGIGVFLGGLWGLRVENEAKEWERCSLSAAPWIRCRVNNWKLYFAKIGFLINSYLLFGLIMAAAMCVQLIADPNHTWYRWSSLVCLTIVLVFEIIRYIIQYQFIENHQGISGVDQPEEFLTTPAYIFHFFKKTLKNKKI